MGEREFCLTAKSKGRLVGWRDVGLMEFVCVCVCLICFYIFKW